MSRLNTLHSKIQLSNVKPEKRSLVFVIMEEGDGNARKRLVGPEERSDSDATTSHSKTKRRPNSDDKVYEGIRGHERHILFHFFTLFSISFFIGVVVIHLSLWMNAHLFNAAVSETPVAGSSVAQDVQANIESSDIPPHATTEGKPFLSLLETTFHYTGSYFENASRNGTRFHARPS